MYLEQPSPHPAGPPEPSTPPMPFEPAAPFTPPAPAPSPSPTSAAWQPQPAQPQPMMQPMAGPQSYGQMPTQPMAQPGQPATSQPNAGQLVLQWLTYAFWGWTLIGLSYLTGLVVANFVNGTNIGGAASYIIAAVLVLLPISFVCDSYYSKIEKHKKSGASMAIMVIHAVIFALCAIGSLITAVFCIVSKFTDSSGNDGTTIALITALIIFVYYAVTFVRTLDPQSFPFIGKMYRFFMIVTVGVMALLGIIGPIAKERQTRTDRLIESNLQTVSTAINDYAKDKSKLPDSLDKLSLENDAKKIVDDDLVEYKPEGEYKSINAYNDPYYKAKTVYKYQLCVVYKKKSSGLYSSYSSSRTGGYDNYLSTYGHKAGNTCYKLLTDYAY